MSIPPSGTYKIVSDADSNCLDAEAGGGKKKCKIVPWVWSGAENQKWQVNPEGAGFRITSLVREKKSGAMLTFADLADEAKGNLWLWDFNGAENQQWIAIPVNPYSYDGTVLIKNVNSGKCLRNMGHGNPVQLHEESRDDKSQWWNFISL